MFLNSKTAKTLAFAAGLVLVPAAAQAEETTFVQDGVTYSYTKTVQKNRTVLTGTVNGRTPFRLVVRGNRVTGEYNHRPTEFSLAEVKPSAEELALR